MIGELGHVALLLALPLALVQFTLPLAGAQWDRPRWVALARPLAAVQWLLVSAALAALIACFVRNDTSLDYVAANGNSSLPLHYRVTATWGGHEGSLLLWAWMLSAWGAAVAARSRALPAAFVARVLAVLGAVALGFLAFIVFTSNPFERLLPAPPDGRDLNPLLQDIGMVAHPPLLYMGYVGFAVAFAFAVAALIEGRVDARWARWVRPWTLAAWASLTGGILLGSFWAYYELGWGGWWFWDAVENAAFMPWLLGTALIHSLAVMDRRGQFQHWTLLLAILAFSLSLLGTFLVRSGVVSSVHAFASDPTRGVFILALLGLASGLPLLLYALRAGQLAGGKPGFVIGSRESLLLLNNVGLAAATGTVLLGTLYPLALEALTGQKVSVGAPYFDSVFVPLMLPLVALLGLGPFARWQRGLDRQALLRELGMAAVGAVALALVLALALKGSLLFGLGLAAGSWALGSTALLAWRQRAAWREPGRWGLWLAHGGIGLFVLGVSLVKGLELSQDLQLRPGEQAVVAGHSLRFVRLEGVNGPNYRAARATLLWQAQDGGDVTTVQPEKRVYTVRQMALTEAAIARSWRRDLYVSLGDALQDGPEGRWALRVQIKPFMAWVWMGALLMALGGIAAALGRRQLRERPLAEPQLSPHPALP